MSTAKAPAAPSGRICEKKHINCGVFLATDCKYDIYQTIMYFHLLI